MLLLPLLLGCHPKSDDTAADTAVPTGDGLFTAGCPVEGRATARVLTDEAERPWGDEALAEPGDVVLLSSKAAFVIQAPDNPRTYYHYGGAPIEAVAVDGCAQAGAERMEELGFIVGQLDIADFAASELHQVRGETIRVVSDGSDGGPAVVEVDATDDRFWLVELTLVRQVYTSGGVKPLGDLFGLDITIRYTLQPDADALDVEVILDGTPVDDGFLVGALVFPSDTTPVSRYWTGELSVGGFGLSLGVPWLAMGAGEGSIAVAMPDANMAYTSVAGVQALLDANQAMAPLMVADGPQTTRFTIGVGATDPASAGQALETALGGEWDDVSGTVMGPDGPVVGAMVEVHGEGEAGEWRVLDRLVTDASGAFSGRTLAMPWRLVATAPGRDASDPVDVSPGGDAVLDLAGAGALVVEATDDAGAPLPVRAELERDDGLRQVAYVMPGDTIAVPPGHWSAWVSHGYTHAVATAEVDVPDGGTATLPVTLAWELDPVGWVSMDTHVHAEASADSDTLAPDRMRTAAAVGLDLAVSTDHEAIVDLSWALGTAGVTDWMSYGLGSEITATVPEHVNAWPFPVVDDPRGEPVRWYELGFPGIYAAIRERGAPVVQLNHSRVNGECGILCVLDWDRLTDPPAIADPTAIGLPAGTEVWSWDFDSFEVMNGLRSPLPLTDDPRRSGALVDWLAFHNLGHPVTGVAVTDVHGLEIPGEPRTWVRAASPEADTVAQGVLDGAAVISAGAFADVSVGGAGPGELGTGDTLAIRVEATRAVDVTRVDVLVDCDKVATIDTTDPGGIVKLDTTLSLGLHRDAYVVTVGYGAEPMPRGLDDYDPATVPRFITNPVFVDVDGDGGWTPPGAKACAG